jgi:release factor glutamine methyltransferase
MGREKLYNSLKEHLKNTLYILDDKPEETIESTIKACWFATAGFPMSAEQAANHAVYDLTDSQIVDLYSLIDQRLKNKPLAYITGRQSFMGIELLSDRRALIPRKETEILGKTALYLSDQIAQEKQIVSVMDICCGSGNLGLAVAHFNSKAFIHSTDMSYEAVALTRDNISLLNLQNRVKVEQGDLFTAFKHDAHFGHTDLIVCNPPYISSAKVTKMNIQISEHEPLLAFDGGQFGFKIIQKLIEESPKFLTNKGWLTFEVGVGQGEFIMQLCIRSNLYRNIETVNDNSGNIRVILAQKSIA